MKTSLIKVGCLAGLLMGSVGNAQASDEDAKKFVALVSLSVLGYAAGYLCGRFKGRLSFLVDQNYRLRQEVQDLRIQQLVNLDQNPSQSQNIMN